MKEAFVEEIFGNDVGLKLNWEYKWLKLDDIISTEELKTLFHDVKCINSLATMLENSVM